MNCDFYKCPNKAEWQVIFKFRAHQNSEPTEQTTEIYACGDCRSKTTPESLLSDVAFRIASDAIAASRNEPPQRSLTTIQWKKIV